MKRQGHGQVQVVLATKNAAKLGELAALLAQLAPDVTLVEGLPWEDVDETGATFEANALAKASAVHAATGLVALADDSGLEVDALGGAPGIRSARYAGASGEAADAANNELLLQRMVGVDDRRCRFRCAVAIVGDGITETVEASVEGTLRREPAGEGGFGYDPLFEPVGWDRTFGEASPSEKASVSHRSKAMRAAVEVLAHLRP